MQHGKRFALVYGGETDEEDSSARRRFSESSGAARMTRTHRQRGAATAELGMFR
jgi:hypothetical protein